MLSKTLLFSQKISNKVFGTVVRPRYMSTLQTLDRLSIFNNRRSKMKQKYEILPPHQIDWQVIGAGQLGAPTSLFLITDTSLYVFNCGEGTQRMANISLAKSINNTRNVFITGRSWKNLGGLPGICLTLKGYGEREITVHGPPGCMDIYEATQGFLLLRGFSVREFNKDKYVDPAVEIKQVVLNRNEQLLPSDIHDSWKMNGSKYSNMKPYVSSVQAYICNFLPRKGRLDAEKCFDKGVPPGPLLGKLKAGEDVTLPDGRVVKSSDVMEDSGPKLSSLVLEIPDLGYMDALLENKSLVENKNLQNMFHFTPPQVLNDERYVNWMKQFNSDVRHVFLNSASTGIGQVSVRIHQAKLRLLNKNLFPPLIGMEGDPGVNFNVDEVCFNFHDMKAVQSTSGLRIQERPGTDVSMNNDLLYDEKQIEQEVMTAEDVMIQEDKEEHIAQLKEAIEYSNNAPKKSAESNEKKYPEISFLGTGSSVPSKYRNCTCILVETKPDQFIIMDCGEGSLGQINRLKGKEGTEHILRNLKCVYISHQHADHHLGSINILIERDNYFKRKNIEIDPLFIVVTGKYNEYLTVYHKKIQSVLTNVELVKCEDLLFHTQKDSYMQEIPDLPKIQLIDPALKSRFLSYTSLSDIETCRAIHCRDAFCVTMTTDSGYKLSYSGDTRPCELFSTMGKDSDLLIHEASFDHCKIKDAMIKKHSTYSEAIEVGKEMNAKFTLLTHFSQRYSKSPLLWEMEGEPNVGIAFDNLVVNPDNLEQLPYLYPGLKQIFHKDFIEMQDRQERDMLNEDEESDQKRVEQEQFKDALIKKIHQRHEDKEQMFKRINDWKKVKENLTTLAHERGKRRFVRRVNTVSIPVPAKLLKINDQPEQDSEDKNRPFKTVKVNTKIAYDNQKMKKQMKNYARPQSSSKHVSDDEGKVCEEEEDAQLAKKAKIDNKIKT